MPALKARPVRGQPARRSAIQGMVYAAPLAAGIWLLIALTALLLHHLL